MVRLAVCAFIFMHNPNNPFSILCSLAYNAPERLFLSLCMRYMSFYVAMSGLCISCARCLKREKMCMECYAVLYIWMHCVLLCVWCVISAVRNKENMVHVLANQPTTHWTSEKTFSSSHPAKTNKQPTLIQNAFHSHFVAWPKKKTHFYCAVSTGAAAFLAFRWTGPSVFPEAFFTQIILVDAL